MKIAHESCSGRLFRYLMFGAILTMTVRHCYGVTSKYIRKLEASADLPLDDEHVLSQGGYNTPEQVHLTQGDHDGRAVIVSWVTPSEPGSSVVNYGTSKGQYEHSANGSITSYKFYDYTSGFIHHCVLSDLEYGTTYFYKLGTGNSTREFSFTTPPRVNQDSSYIFGIIGDLGQTYDSLKTLEHYLGSKGQTVLYVGDLSYADHYPYDSNVRWDTWGRLVEPSTAYQPWIWTAGNHEIEYLPQIGEVELFKPYRQRYHVPHTSSGSLSPLWYSIKRASAYIIVLSSYSSYAKYTPQWNWLQKELPKVKRHETPWLIVLMHTPLYNSNSYHYMEGESMRVQFEPWFVKFKVDIVFAGHVHAYERTHRVSNVLYDIENNNCVPVYDKSAPMYVTIGDGGNIEGIAGNFRDPQPAYSAYREASFGHALLDIKNRTHAYYSWHRNQDGKAVVADSFWLSNRHHGKWEEHTNFGLPRRRKLPLKL
ncbi:hypothetical protein O6H91_02G155100 [Diphasiastrum complanatum]|uniref:Uncharacterized protein n=1 Tax=Diphasiastrum complanatum TaxID=34168 RepID=A0ACC2EMB2_DIPCM|nr:hypothetical protein O6H91_Y409600 [Diphasiastrum complanatum]KAJ7297253.1 hypothetical protein O6H91_Y069900 [Diphasiastrum complanatum]KAJ7567603.1 hypothetical protein O6H91_02G155100 [Diphasiastrum complanatum]